MIGQFQPLFLFQPQLDVKFTSMKSKVQDSNAIGH